MHIEFKNITTENPNGKYNRYYACADHAVGFILFKTKNGGRK